MLSGKSNEEGFIHIIIRNGKVKNKRWTKKMRARESGSPERDGELLRNNFVTPEKRILKK